jgi:hypothetical protein
MLFPPDCIHLVLKFKWVFGEISGFGAEISSFPKIPLQVWSDRVLNHGQNWSYTEYGPNKSHIQLCSS